MSRSQQLTPLPIPVANQNKTPDALRSVANSFYERFALNEHLQLALLLVPFAAAATVLIATVFIEAGGEFFVSCWMGYDDRLRARTLITEKVDGVRNNNVFEPRVSRGELPVCFRRAGPSRKVPVHTALYGHFTGRSFLSNFRRDKKQVKERMTWRAVNRVFVLEHGTNKRRNDVQDWFPDRLVTVDRLGSDTPQILIAEFKAAGDRVDTARKMHLMLCTEVPNEVREVANMTGRLIKCKDGVWRPRHEDQVRQLDTSDCGSQPSVRACRSS